MANLSPVEIKKLKPEAAAWYCKDLSEVEGIRMGFGVLFIVTFAFLILFISFQGAILGGLIFLIGWLFSYKLDSYFKTKNDFYKDRMRLFCPDCRKYIDMTANWVCGKCNEEVYASYLTNDLLSPCPKCLVESSSVICPHCGELLNLTENDPDEYPAQIKGSTFSGNPNSLKQTKELQDLEFKKKKADMSAALLQSEIRLENMNESRKEKVKRPQEEVLKDSLSDFNARHLAIYQIADDELKKAKEKYGLDSDTYRRTQEAVDAWKEENM